MVVQEAILEKTWISKEEKDIVNQLHERVRDLIPPEESESEESIDAFLLRWLIAREMNVDKAESMLKAALQWRKENDVDNALQKEPDSFLTENYRWTFLSTDFEGHPVAICPFNEWDFRKMIAADKTDKFDHFVQHYFESVLRDTRIYNRNRKPGQAPVNQFFVILDATGYAYGQLLSFGAMRKWFQMASTYEAFYPETVHRLMFLNCPSYFQMFLNMLKAFLAPRTLNKITCYSNIEDWKKEIGNFMDPATIPEQYGGTCKVNPLERPANTE